MLADARPVCFVLTADLGRARQFYTENLGLTETGEDPYAVSYDLAGTLMRLTLVEGHAGGPHTVLGWQVADIASAVDDLAKKGVIAVTYEGFGQDERGIWTDPQSGTRIAWFLDPDGNNLSLTQFAP